MSWNKRDQRQTRVRDVQGRWHNPSRPSSPGRRKRADVLVPLTARNTHRPKTPGHHRPTCAQHPAEPKSSRNRDNAASMPLRLRPSAREASCHRARDGRVQKPFTNFVSPSLDMVRSRHPMTGDLPFSSDLEQSNAPSNCSPNSRRRTAFYCHFGSHKCALTPSAGGRLPLGEPAWPAARLPRSGYDLSPQTC